MDDFKSDIISNNKKGRFYFYGFAVVVVLAVALLMYLQIIPVFGQIISILIWLFAVSSYALQTKKQVLKKTIGELVISSDFISIDNNRYHFTDISIKILVSGWKSYKRSNDRSQPVSEMHNGDENYLTIIFGSNTTKVEFLLNSKEHWECLREHVISWYKKGIRFSENSGGGKTYGLMSLNYSEIQEFKKQVKTLKSMQA